MQTLESLGLALNGTVLVGSGTQFVGKMVEVNVFEHVLNRLSTHHCNKLIGVVVWKKLVIWIEVVNHIIVIFLRKELTIEDVLFSILGCTSLNDDVTLIIDDCIQFLGGKTQQITNFVRQ